MSDANGGLWEYEEPEDSRMSCRETLEYLRSAPFAIVRADHLALAFVRRPSGQPLLSVSLLKVLLCLLLHVNWDPGTQGGYAACWPGSKAIARETGLSESAVIKHLAALSDGPYIDRSRNRDVRYAGLRVIRKATPDEAAKVREHLGAVGRPTTVWILCHPRDWRLPIFAQEEFEKRLAQLRSRPARKRRATGSGRPNGRESTPYDREPDGGAR